MWCVYVCVCVCVCVCVVWCSVVWCGVVWCGACVLVCKDAIFRALILSAHVRISTCTCVATCMQLCMIRFVDSRSVCNVECMDDSA